jgi:hypothetical protein
LVAALIVVMEGCQTLAFVRWQSRFVGTSLKPNGPAIKGVCVGLGMEAVSRNVESG